MLKHFKPLSLGDIHGCLNAGRPIPDGSLFLSFDDGFREMSEVVAPICREKGIPATFFLTTGFLDNKILGYRHKASLLIEAYQHHGEAVRQAAVAHLARRLGAHIGVPSDWRLMILGVGYRQREVLDECAELLELDFDEYLKQARPYLTREQVRGLLSDGFSIGGHSIDHPRYAELSVEDQIAQTRGCMEDLGRDFRPPVKAFAFPFVSDGVPERFYEEMFASQTVDLAFCIGQMPKAQLAVQRFGVEGERANSLRDLLARQAEGRLRQNLATWKRSVLVL